jgi:propanediol dehydratase small subunit
MMAGLFISGGAADVVERAEVMSEIVAKMPGATYRAIKNGDQLSNAELKWVVDTLRSAKQADKLQDYVGEAANMAALRAAGVES